ncbi:MAG TPA: GAF domain-containing sensor histidine kinase [Caldimonas sp.]|nr:GAF domain-containing sensor histidine kinase [Caldimonas sp.]
MTSTACPLPVDPMPIAAPGRDPLPREANVPTALDASPGIARDLASIGRIDAVPTLLRVLCDTTGMGFAAVARVTEGHWTACAVLDRLGFGLEVGGELDVGTTLCKEVREARAPIVIEHVSEDAAYCRHPTPQIYGFESYVSVPIILANGDYFGTLCALDPKPAPVAEPRIVSTFMLFAELIALQLDNDRKRDQVQQALLDEREAGELREQFIAVLGHDLRNPLAAIGACGYVLALKADERATVAGLATRINKNVRRMSALIDDVLDFARGRLGGGIALRAATVADLARPLLAVVAELRDVHPERAIDCHVDVAGTVFADVTRLQQLASNLLANALVHGAQAEAVTFSAVRRGDTLRLEVGNGGEPIAPEHLARLFAPFWRQSLQGEGLGLGLYISDQIVKAHGGTMDVSSSREHGTRFVATLPLAPASIAD